MSSSLWTLRLLFNQYSRIQFPEITGRKQCLLQNNEAGVDFYVVNLTTSHGQPNTRYPLAIFTTELLFKNAESIIFYLQCTSIGLELAG